MSPDQLGLHSERKKGRRGRRKKRKKFLASAFMLWNAHAYTYINR